MNRHLECCRIRGEIDYVIFAVIEFNIVSGMIYITPVSRNQVGYVFVYHKRHCKTIALVLHLRRKKPKVIVIGS